MKNIIKVRSPKVWSRSEVRKGSNLTWSRTHHRSFKCPYSRSRQNPILKISNFPANSGKVRYPNEKVLSVAIALAHRPAREMAILVDPPRAKALGDQLKDNPLDFVSWISPAIFP